MWINESVDTSLVATILRARPRCPVSRCAAESTRCRALRRHQGPKGLNMREEVKLRMNEMNACVLRTAQPILEVWHVEYCSAYSGGVWSAENRVSKKLSRCVKRGTWSGETVILRLLSASVVKPVRIRTSVDAGPTRNFICNMTVLTPEHHYRQSSTHQQVIGRWC